MTRFVVSLLLLYVAIARWASAADPPVPPPQSDAALKVDSVELLKVDEPGTAVLKFTVEAPEGTRFFVQYQHSLVRGAAGNNGNFEMDSDGLAEVTITMKYRPDFKGDRTVGVLMSQQEMLDYAIDVTGCKGGRGHSTIVSAPVWNVPPDERSMKVFTTSENASSLTADGWRRLLAISRKQPAAAEPSATNPRSEIVVGLYKDVPKPRFAAATRLARQWQRQQQEIGSSHIKYRHLRIGDGSLQALTRDNVSRVLLDADLEDHPEKFPEAAAKLINRPEIVDKPWAEGEFFSIGLKTRDNTAFHTRLFDGELDFNSTPASKQMDVFHGANPTNHRTTLGEFRIVPNPGFDAAPYVEKELPSGRVLLSRETDTSLYELLVDLASGFVRHTLDENRHKMAILQVKEEFQYGPTMYPGRIVFPKLIVRASYFNEQLCILEMLMIDEAEFNENLPKGTFAMAAKAGTNVFIDVGAGADKRLYHPVHVDVDDLAEQVRDWEQAEIDAADK